MALISLPKPKGAASLLKRDWEDHGTTLRSVLMKTAVWMAFILFCLWWFVLYSVKHSPSAICVVTTDNDDDGHANCSQMIHFDPLYI